MLNRLTKGINISIRILILTLLILIIFFAKSLYLIMFITNLLLIILILSGKSVKEYVQAFKNLILWLLFVVLTYIIICGCNINTLVFSYKLILCLILITNFFINLNFAILHKGIYKILNMFKKTKINVYELSFNITIYIYSLLYLIETKNKIIEIQTIKNKRNYSIKNYLMPRLIATNNEVKNQKNNLRLKFYHQDLEKLNFKSIVLLIIFLIFFITVVYKEVVL